MRASSVVDPNLWSIFIAAVFIFIFLDLAVFHRGDKEVKFKPALITCGFWISLALLFNLWFATRYGRDLGIQFLTGYLIELSLSVDNLFVILLVFKAFKIPSKFHHRVLFWGILGAVVFRGIFIIIGAKLVQQFEWILYIFGGILFISAVKLLISTDKEQDVTHHWAVRLVGRFLPMSHELHGNHFVIRNPETHRFMGTPLLLTLAVVEASDIIFAVDSIPAVFSVTKDGFVAFASNILAVLGLRSLYFIISTSVGKLRYLKPGLAAILGFVGLKMMLVNFFHIPSGFSLLVIVSILTTAALSSWYVNHLETRSKN